MGILKDFREHHDGYRISIKVFYFFSPRVWLRLHKYRKQRADRGWSDKDTWGAGEYIARMTAEMLQHLNDNSYVDWPQWFKVHVQDKKSGSYNNLQSIIDDINNYLDLSVASWADGLVAIDDEPEKIFSKREDGTFEYKSPTWIDQNGKKLTEKQITTRIKNRYKQEEKLHKKATDAMQFFGKYFTGFWD